MTTALTAHYVLTDDELQVVGARSSVEDFPIVLGIGPRHGTTEVLGAARDRATRTLASRGIIAGGRVDPDLAAAVRSLHRPDRELAMRLVTPEGMTRVSIVRQGSLGVLARRVGNEFVLRTHGGGLAAATRTLLGELPQMKSAPIEPVGAPLEALTESLDAAAGNAPRLGDRIRALAIEARPAMLLGSALSSRMAFAEIVYRPLTRDEDRVLRCPAAVAVFYTKRGRIVAAPSDSPRGELWSTLKPGSDHAITSAIGQLIGLSTERWGDE